MSGASTYSLDWGDVDLSEVKEALRSGSMEVAQAIVDEAKRLCPVQAGTMRDSIHVTVRATGAGVSVDDPVAAHVEFGHDEILHGHKVGHVPQHPFLRPAIKNVARRFGESWGGAVGSYAGGVAGGQFGTVGAKYGRRYGKQYGKKVGGEFWAKVGNIAANMVEADSKETFGTESLNLADHLASGVTVKRGSVKGLI